MNSTPQTTELNHAIADFEKLVASLPKPDDVRDWCKELGPAFDRFESLVQAQRRRIHEKLFSKIAAQDPARHDQILEFKKVDHEIENLLDVVKTHIMVLGLPKSELEQENVEHQMMELIDRGSQLIFWVKSQEENVAVWFAEAFTDSS